MKESLRLRRRLAGYAILISCLVLIGWGFGLPWLVTPQPGWVFMRPITALGILLLAMGLCGARGSRFSVWAGMAVAALGSSFLLDLATGGWVGASHWLSRPVVLPPLAPDARTETLDWDPARGMPANSAFCLLALGSSLAIMHLRESRHGSRAAFGQALALVACLVALFCVGAYFYDVEAVTQWRSRLAMPLATALCVLALGIGILLVDPAKGIMGVITSHGPGGQLVRRLGAVTFFVPVLFGWIFIMAERQGAFTVPTGTLALVIATAFVFMAAILLSSHKLDEAAAALRKSELRYGALMDAVPQLVWETDAEGRAVFLNRGWLEFTGTRIEDNLGDGWLDRLHPDDAIETRRIRRDALRSGEAYETEFRLRSAGTGPHLGTYRWYLEQSRPTFDRPGKIARWVGTATDIHAAKMAEDALRLQAEAGSILASSLDCASSLRRFAQLALPKLGDWCMVDELRPDGSISQVAAAHADPSRQPSVEILGTLIPSRTDSTRGVAHVLESGQAVLRHDVTDPAWLAEDLGFNDARPVIALGARSYMIVPLIARGRKLGTVTYVSSREERRFGPEDLKIAEDLALRAAAAIDNALLYQDAQKAVGLREDLMATVSHDLKNPLGVVLMNSRLLERKLSELPAPTAPEEASRAQKMVQQAETILRAAQRMRSMIDDLLDLSRLDAGHLRMQRREIAAAELVRDTVDLLRPLAEQKSLSLSIGLEAAMGVLWCDPMLAGRVLQNLLGNAIKFTPEGGTVRIEALPQGKQVLFAVIDSGPGIAAEDLPRLFDRYWQASQTARQGTGLGLAIAKGIVDAHGGRIWAESRFGEGSAFRFTLPQADARAAAPFAEKQAS